MLSQIECVVMGVVIFEEHEEMRDSILANCLKTPYLHGKCTSGEPAATYATLKMTTRGSGVHDLFVYKRTITWCACMEHGGRQSDKQAGGLGNRGNPKT